MKKVSAAEAQLELLGTPQNQFGRSPERVAIQSSEDRVKRHGACWADVGLGISLGAVFDFQGLFFFEYKSCWQRRVGFVCNQSARGYMDE